MRNLFQILVVVVAVLGLGLGGAFGVGTWYGRRTAPETSAPAAATSSSAEPAAAGRLAALGGSAAQGGATPTTGVVEEMNGDTVTIRTQAGGAVSVKLQPDTQVQQQAAAATSDIKPGTTITVTGQPDVDGKIAARSVQIGGAGGARPAGATAGPGATPGPAGTPPARRVTTRAQPSASPGR